MSILCLSVQYDQIYDLGFFFNIKFQNKIRQKVNPYFILGKHHVNTSAPSKIYAAVSSVSPLSGTTVAPRAEKVFYSTSIRELHVTCDLVS